MNTNSAQIEKRNKKNWLFPHSLYNATVSLELTKTISFKKLIFTKESLCFEDFYCP